ncbi:MAG: glycosyltransferase family 9 protein [Candidatus Omnitrophica bacterium]|nr:glycosyltransferase family 9 protein [Candidatus Omnitrophota bacterium]
MENSVKEIIKSIYFIFRRIPLCILAIFLPSGKKSEFSGARILKIVAIRIDRIGDIIVSMPALKALKQVFPEARISLLVSRQNEPLAKCIPYVDEVLVYEGLFKTSAKLQKKGFDLAVDLMMDYTLKTALLTAFIRSRFRAGFDIGGRGILFSLRFKPRAVKSHMSRHIFDLINFIAAARTGGSLTQEAVYRPLDISDENRSFAINTLKENGITLSEFIVCMHPGGKFPSQRWPAESFARLADILIADYKARIIFIGSKDDEPLIKRIASLMKQGPAQAIGLPLDKTAGLISQAKLFIGNNSGLLHIACCLNVPTVSTLGPTDPYLWRPEGDNNIVVTKSLPCSPCSRPVCADNGCLRLITVGDMLEAVKSTYARGRT